MKEIDADMIESIEMWLHEIEPKWVEKELNWLEELRSRLLEEETPDDLEEAAIKYQESVPVDTTIHYCGADEDVYFANRIVETFIAGAKWKEKQDQETIELAEDHAYLAGAVNEREKMLKEAVKGEIFDDYDKDTCEHHLTILSTVPSGYKDGDKIRIIIVKEDEK